MNDYINILFYHCCISLIVFPLISFSEIPVDTPILCNINACLNLKIRFQLMQKPQSVYAPGYWKQTSGIYIKTNAPYHQI